MTSVPGLNRRGG